VDLGADMVRDQAHDALAIGGDSARPYRPALRRAGRSRAARRVQHHLDDGRVFQKPGDGGPSAVRSMRAPRAIASGFWWLCRHVVPVPDGDRRHVPGSGMIKRAEIGRFNKYRSS
jgi:hypothetical protein